MRALLFGILLTLFATKGYCQLSVEDQIAKADAICAFNYNKKILFTITSHDASEEYQNSKKEIKWYNYTNNIKMIYIYSNYETFDQEAYFYFDRDNEPIRLDILEIKRNSSDMNDIKCFKYMFYLNNDYTIYAYRNEEQKISINDFLEYSTLMIDNTFDRVDLNKVPVDKVADLIDVLKKYGLNVK
ncbi:MAG: hypothetical protein IKQ46_11035 [Bacteroidales bacterium]|jgi:hypothetical protein|nr:hypothetical protein [Bacteroidales bacterium]